MTEKLYYQDAYIRQFSATVLEMKLENGMPAIRLNRTAFYPEGGGQGADHGAIVFPDGRRFHVTDVQEAGGEIWHYGTWNRDASQEPAFFSSIDVECEIDWNRRFDHMQQHSGEHIVSGMICRRFHCDNVGFHMGDDVVTIDFNHRINMQEAEEVEEQANRYIWEDHPFQILWPSEEDLKSLDYRSKKELEGEVRIARFPGADTCACCGTHVSGSAQIGLVKFLSAKNFHEGTRLELLCGKRAAEYLSMNYHVNKAAAVMLSTSEENTAEHVEKLIQDNIRLKADCTALKERLLDLQAQQYRNAGNVYVVDDVLEPDQARPLADRIAGCCGGMAAVFARDGDKYRYAVIDRVNDISGFIRTMNQSLNGKGGGRNGFAQGSVMAEKGEIKKFFEINFK